LPALDCGNGKVGHELAYFTFITAKAQLEL
jgi:hypothetical protein